MGRRSDYKTPEAIQALTIDAAEYIVAKHGVEGMNARSIARNMGYAPGTIYVVFKNMQEVKLHVNARTLQRLHTELVDAIAHCRHPETCIKKLAYTYLFFAIDNIALWNLLFSPHPRNEKIPRWYLSIIEDIFEIVESVLPDYIRTKRERFKAARAIWAGVHGICTLAVTNKLAITEVKSGKKILDMLVNSFLAGQRELQG